MDTTQISRFLLDLGRLSAQAGILVLLVFVAQGMFRKQLAPRWRSALWFLVALRLVLPFSFSSATSIFNLLPDWPRARVEAPAPMPPSVNFYAAATPQMPMALRGDLSPSTPVSRPEMIPSSAPAPVRRWPIWIFAAWLMGVVLLSVQVVVSSVRFWRRCSKLRPVLEPDAVEVLEKCCEQLGVRARPMLLEGMEVSSPGLHGLLRPRLLLPKGFTARFSSAELQFVFLHELAHLKRRDLWLNWIMAVLQVIHWFNPLVWLAFSRWRTDREMACDAMALEAAGQERNQEYGRTILRLLENFAHPVSTPDLVGILEDKRQLHRRIAMIAGYMPAKGWPVLAAVVAVGLAAIGLTDARSQATSSVLLSTANSQQRDGYDIHLNNQNSINGSAGVTLVAAPATSNFNGWHAEGMTVTASTQSADDLTGAWVLVGTPDKIGKIPASGGRVKFYLGKTFSVTQADPKTGVVIFHHGGTFALNGDEYVEAVHYANPTTMNFIGATNGHFHAKLEGDTLTLIGIDNPWKEVWKRIDKPAAASAQTVKDMIGTWAYAGKLGGADKVPKEGVGYKFITASDWCDTQADPKTGVVVIHHGGTWAFKGDDYVETVKYANPGTLNLMGHTFKFNAKVEGDTLTLKGIGNPWNEVWKRVK